MKKDTHQEQNEKYNSKEKIAKNTESIQKIIEYYTKYKGEIPSYKWLNLDIKTTLGIEMPYSTLHNKLHAAYYFLKDGKLTYEPPENPIHTFAELVFKHYYDDYLALRLRKSSYASLVVKILNTESKEEKLGYHCTHIDGVILCFFNKEKITSAKDNQNTKHITSSEMAKKIIAILEKHNYDESLY